LNAASDRFRDSPILMEIPPSFGGTIDWRGRFNPLPIPVCAPRSGMGSTIRSPVDEKKRHLRSAEDGQAVAVATAAPSGETRPS